MHDLLHYDLILSSKKAAMDSADLYPDSKSGAIQQNHNGYVLDKTEY